MQPLHSPLTDPPATKTYTLPLHDALPILCEFNAELRKKLKKAGLITRDARIKERKKYGQKGARRRFQFRDRKSTRLNSSHLVSSYAVFCLKRKKLSEPPQIEPVRTK